MLKKILNIIAGITGSIVILAVLSWFAFVPSPKEPAYVFVTAWGKKGVALGQFDDPTGIALAGNQIFVSDARNGRIQVFGLDGKFLRAFGKPGKGLGELGRPMNLAISKGEVFVPEYFNDRIQVFALDGTARRVIGKAGAGDGEFNAPGGVAVGLDGALYVADFYNHRIQKLSSDGTFVRQWGQARPKGQGSGAFTALTAGAASFSYPTDVSVSSEGALFVADGYNDRVQSFKPDGTPAHKWGGPFAMNIHGPFNGWFATVASIAVGPRGNIFVADFYNHRVQKFAPDGVFLTSFGRRGSGPGELDYPMGIAISKDGTVFVVDYGNNRITKWKPR